MRHLTSTGEVAAGWPADGLPISTLPASQIAAQVVPDGAGGALLAWADFRDGTIDLYAQRVTAEGEIPWTAAGVRMMTDRAMRAVEADGAGGAYAAGATLGPASNDQYSLQRFTGAGTLAPGWPANGVPIRPAPDARDGLVMVPDGAGGAHVLLCGPDPRRARQSVADLERGRRLRARRAPPGGRGEQAHRGPARFRARGDAHRGHLPGAGVDDSAPVRSLAPLGYSPPAGPAATPPAAAGGAGARGG